MKLTHKRLLELLSYDHDTGEFRWNVTKGSAHKGSVCNAIRGNGYLTVTLDKESIYLHRLAWFYIHKEWPHEIDHINHNKKDNRISNLRNVTSRGNKRNLRLRPDNTSGCTGVSLDKRSNKWAACIVIDGKKCGLGYFATIDEAVAARKSAERVHNFHPNHGSSTR
jgi:hypothetical protein